MSNPVFEITKAARFDAAHNLPGAADERYRRMHGHSFAVEASLRGAAGEASGWVADLGQLEEMLAALAGELDHGLLNATPGLETPTLERLCLYFAERLKARFPTLSRVAVSRPSVGERCVLRLADGDRISRP